MIEIPSDLYRIEAHEDKFATPGDKFASGIVNARVRTLPPLSVTFTLNYVIEFGSASAADLLATPMTGEWELPPNKVLHDFLIDINDDAHPESVENFFVGLEVPAGTSLPPGYSLIPGRSEVTIADNDVTLVGFANHPGVREDAADPSLAGGGLIVGTQEGPLGVTVTLHYVIEDGTAVLGEDYEPSPDPNKVTGTITLYPPGLDASGSPIFVKPGDYKIPISVIDDDLVEPDETFIVRLMPPPKGLPTDRDVDGNELDIKLYRDTFEITIFNDDDVVINFNDAPDIDVREDRGVAIVPISVSPPPGSPTTRHLRSVMKLEVRVPWAGRTILGRMAH